MCLECGFAKFRNTYVQFDFTRVAERECLRDFHGRQIYEQNDDLRDTRAFKRDAYKYRRKTWHRKGATPAGCYKGGCIHKEKSLWSHVRRQKIKGETREFV